MRDFLHFAVLRERSEFEVAHEELVRRGLVPSVSWGDRLRSRLRRPLRRPDAGAVGRPDPLKSWDVRRAVRAIEASLERPDAILDMGSLASAIPPALSVLGYSNLHGIDLDEQILEMGREHGITYVVGDLTATDWPDAHFAAITAISVIEHGVDQDALFKEVARLLRPGGLFLFSTDYWPEKVDTEGTELFGLPWTIFSAEDVTRFVERARGYGLAPVSDHTAPLHQAQQRPIQFANRNYTFLYGALVKEGARK
jgi:SAM-dependent methyltransferase